MPQPPRSTNLDEIRSVLHRLFISAPETNLRLEDEKKCRELSALLDELSRLPRKGLLVDAAAGKSALGLLAARLLGFERLWIIEKDALRIEACRRALAALPESVACELRQADVGDISAWPEAPATVVALHACGAACDAVIDASISVRAKRLWVVPCCYSESLPFGPRAREIAAGLGIVRHGALRSTLTCALVDAERTLRLEAAGYTVETVRFVPTSVTPHNLLLRARLNREPVAMAEAERQRKALLGKSP